MKMAVTVGRVTHIYICISNEIKLNYCYTLENKSAVDLGSQKLKNKITNNRIIKIEDIFKKYA